jgi:hypothetical protein
MSLFILERVAKIHTGAQVPAAVSFATPWLRGSFPVFGSHGLRHGLRRALDHEDKSLRYGLGAR